MTLAQSKLFYNTWYIFRDNGAEVKVKIGENDYEATHTLSKAEERFIMDNLISIKVQSKINKHKQEIKDRYS